MVIRFLGTGTSTGVPQIGCRCRVCTSNDPRDKRLRTSALVTTDNQQNLLIDCGPDFRAQMLAADAPQLSAVLLTHIHYDHVGGIDDMRPYCGQHPNFPVYCRPDVAENMRNRIPYCFGKNLYLGVPTFDLRTFDDDMPFNIGPDQVTPLPFMHNVNMPIVGYRIGRLAYVTDCVKMPEESIEKMRGVDTLVINALRHKEHPSHMNLQQALDVIAAVNPRIAYLIHLSHDMGCHAEVEPTLPPNVRIAYDGLTITID